MNTQKILALSLIISIHNNFCMITTPNNQTTARIITTKKYLQNNNITAASDYFLHNFINRSAEENTILFSKQKKIVKKMILNQTNYNSLIYIITLPKDLQISCFSHLFKDPCPFAAEKFYTTPFSQVIKKLNNSSYLTRKKQLTDSECFLLTPQQENIITSIYQGKIIPQEEIENLKQQLHPKILNKLQHNGINACYYPENIYHEILTFVPTAALNTISAPHTPTYYVLSNMIAIAYMTTSVLLNPSVSLNQEAFQLIISNGFKINVSSLATCISLNILNLCNNLRHSMIKRITF